MPFQNHGRQYDLVVFGATGYTGKYTAEHIATNLPTNLKWALAGRSREKLEKLAADIRPLNPDRQQPDFETCELNDEQLDALAKKTFILITTVGPYGLFGEHAFKACAENGTHYFDVTGEVPYVARMIHKYENVAKQSGSMLFPQIGIESAPADIVAWSLSKHNRTQLDAKTGEVVMSVQKLNAAASGGTLATVLTFFDMFTLKEIAASMKPYALSPVPNPKAASQSRPLTQKLSGTRYVPSLGVQTTFVAGDSDRAIVERTWGLLSQIPSKKKEFYGPDFHFSEHLRVRNWLSGLFVHLGISLAGILFVVAPPVRWLLKKLVYAQGQGPDIEQSKKHEIEYRAIGKPDGWKENGDVASCKASFNGSMYHLTGIFLAQAALTVLEDDIDLGGGGVFTPACLGQGFVDRVHAAGFRIETKTAVV
ncbi:hypothetical protein N0V93_005792 [Gnomoniopsis smithogilvyi]|uniref:Saccharopine dehydrogenase NADP binding domain-containing protein n=1 Tax=Gnomoniopsis smithogilvyi TaxID=1191159 RepID=A0A9W8YTZ2_9PEZI|nr:hypothetical protein N0V93_005792 [Gnomoniopsis smithogilvyi]